MKALILTKHGTLAYGDAPEPVPASGGVRIAVKACGICGSDVHGMDGSTGRRQPPIIMGHEAAGVIDRLGEGVTGWSIGDRVTFDSTVYCNVCAFCRAGRINLCESRQVLGVSCDEYRRDGAFADHVVVPQHILYRVPERVSLVQASLAEPLSIALHAVSRCAPLEGRRVLVVGAGIIGLLIVQAAKSRGCDRIVAVDLDANRRDCALEHGADEAYGEVPADRDFDAAFEAVGVAATVGACVGAVRKGGDVVLVGNLAPEAPLPLQQVVTRELRLHGSCASAGEYGLGLQLIADGRIGVDALISAVAPLSQGAEWFGRLYAGNSGLLKVVLQPGSE